MGVAYPRPSLSFPILLDARGGAPAPGAYSTRRPPPLSRSVPAPPREGPTVLVMLRLIAATLSLSAALTSAGLHAQAPSDGPAFGVVAGPVDAVQLRERAPDSDHHSGFMVGAWADVPTPTSWLTVLAEATAVRRGGEYDQGPDLPVAVVDADYLAFSIFPALRLGLGPVSLTAYAGPSLDVHLRSRSAIPLQQAFREPSTQVFAAVTGAGLEVTRGRAVFRIEARRHEQISSAYSGAVDGLRHRSTEIVARVGMHPPGRR